MADVATLLASMDTLIAEVRGEAAMQMKAWKSDIERAGFAASAMNFAHYLALRRRDLRPLQRPLMALGLSSLGRLESRVLPTLVAVRTALGALIGHATHPKQPIGAFFAGEARLAAHARELLGTSASSPPVALLVTCPPQS